MYHEYKQQREQIQSRQRESNRKGDRGNVIKLFGQRHILAVQYLKGVELENEILEISSKIKNWSYQLYNKKSNDSAFSPKHIAKNINVVNDVGSYLLFFSRTPTVGLLNLNNIDMEDTEALLNELRKKNGFLISADDGDKEAFTAYIFAILYADITRNIDVIVENAAYTDLAATTAKKWLTKNENPLVEYDKNNVMEDLDAQKQANLYSLDEIKEAKEKARDHINPKIRVELADLSNKLVEELTNNRDTAEAIFDKFTDDQQSSFGIIKKSGAARLCTIAIYGFIFTMSLTYFNSFVKEQSYTTKYTKQTRMIYTPQPCDNVSLFGYGCPPDTITYEEVEVGTDVETEFYYVLYLIRVMWWAFIPLSQLIDGVFILISDKANDYKNVLKTAGMGLGMFFIALAVGHMSGLFEYQIPSTGMSVFPDSFEWIINLVVGIINVVIKLALTACSKLAEGVQWVQTTETASKFLALSAGIKILSTARDEATIFREYIKKRKTNVRQLKQELGDLAFNMDSFRDFRSNLGKGGSGGLTSKVSDDIKLSGEVLQNIINIDAMHSRKQTEYIRGVGVAQAERGLLLQERMTVSQETIAAGTKQIEGESELTDPIFEVPTTDPRHWLSLEERLFKLEEDDFDDVHETHGSITNLKIDPYEFVDSLETLTNIDKETAVNVCMNITDIIGSSIKTMQLDKRMMVPA